MTENDPRSTKALRIFVTVVLGLPVLYWILFYFTGKAGIELNRGVFGTLRSYGPALGAVFAIAYVGGKTALRDLWKNVINWRVSGRLYALALLGPLMLMCLAISVLFVLEPGTPSPGGCELPETTCHLNCAAHF